MEQFSQLARPPQKAALLPLVPDHPLANNSKYNLSNNMKISNTQAQSRANIAFQPQNGVLKIDNFEPPRKNAFYNAARGLNHTRARTSGKIEQFSAAFLHN